jgi:predicted short-subunit dehydrogenase-like oxidoreductase (DUF2520 family)
MGSKNPVDRPSIAVVGCGKLGNPLGFCLKEKGYPIVGLASRRLASTETLAAECGCSTVSERPWEATREADLVFLTVPDDAIEKVCATIAARGGIKANAAVFHCSGSQPSTILAAARQSGGVVASLHPLQSFAGGKYTTNPFAGIVMSVEGDDPACRVGKGIIADLEAHPLEIETDGKVLYHAAAVVASNYLVVLMDIALAMMESAGVARKRAFGILEPLVAGTLANLSEKETRKALTGPVARGDVATVAAHTASLADKLPELLPLYRQLGSHAVGLAKKSGGLDAKTVARLVKLLSEKA